ncbi:MAG: hypothetical protein V3U80_08870 [Flavobacteriaceae bacterium]
MNFLLKSAFTLLIILSFNSCKKSTNLSNKKETKTVWTKDNFPSDWAGNYSGDLNIFSVDSIGMNLKMDLKIEAVTDSVYTWQLTYKMDGKEADVRAYELNLVNEKRGHYIINEKNTIKIDAFYRNRIFTSFFKVMDSYIIATYTREKNDIVFEIISASDKEKTITGNTTYNGEEIPEVTTYFINGRQKGILKKVVPQTD